MDLVVPQEYKYFQISVTDLFYATDWFVGKDTTGIADESWGAVRRAQKNEGQSQTP